MRDRVCRPVGTAAQAAVSWSRWRCSPRWCCSPATTRVKARGDARRAGARAGAAAGRHLALAAAADACIATRCSRRSARWWRSAVVAARGGDRQAARAAGAARGASRSRSGSRSRPGARRRTCWCRCTSSSPPARWRSSCRRCGDGVRRARLPSRRDREDGRRRRRRPRRALDRAAAGAVRRALRNPGGVLAGLREGAAADGVLLRPVRAGVLPAAPDRLDAAADPQVPGAAWRRWPCCSRCVGFVEYATKTIILNPRLVVANDLHTYFTVNSVFFDPDIFGRFLALVMIMLGRGAAVRRAASVSSWSRSACWRSCGAGCVLTLSRSSLGALLVGLGTLAALRWRVVAGGVRGGRRWWRSAAAAVAISPEDVRAQPGAQRRLERPRRTSSRAASTCSSTARCGATARARS